MKCSIRIIALALALAPAAVFAQSSNQPLTRAQVQDQLTQLRPSKLHYPADIQAAEARVAAQGTAGATSTTGFGGTPSGTMQSGSSTIMRPHAWRSMYSHH